MGAKFSRTNLETDAESRSFRPSDAIARMGTLRDARAGTAHRECVFATTTPESDCELTPRLPRHSSSSDERRTTKPSTATSAKCARQRRTRRAPCCPSLITLFVFQPASPCCLPGQSPGALPPIMNTCHLSPSLVLVAYSIQPRLQKRKHPHPHFHPIVSVPRQTSRLSASRKSHTVADLVLIESSGKSQRADDELSRGLTSASSRTLSPSLSLPPNPHLTTSVGAFARALYFYKSHKYARRERRLARGRCSLARARRRSRVPFRRSGQGRRLPGLS